MTSLECAGVGCQWRHYFSGAARYTDDIALLAPLPLALRLMFAMCGCFAYIISLVLNAARTQLIQFAHLISFVV